jgi:hypothetical protein
MKQVLTGILLFFLGINSMVAQDRTLLNESKIESIGGFGGPIIQVSQIGDGAVASFGGGGGVVLNDFFIGGFGSGLGIERWQSDFEEYDVDLGYGGLWLGYSFLDDRAVHPYVSLQAAVGALDIGRDDFIDTTIDEFTVGVLLPEIGAEVNLTSWFKLSATIGYRWVSDFDRTDIIAPEDIRSAYLGINLRFGYFGG